MNTLHTVISCYSQLYHVHTLLLHGSIGIHTLIISVFLLHGSLFIFHELLLHEYSCIPATWLFPVTDIDIPVTRHINCWYAMCGTKCHVDPSHGATSRIPHLLFSVFHYLVLCYQQSSYFVIVLHIPRTILIPDILYSLNIINTTWGWENLMVD